MADEIKDPFTGIPEEEPSLTGAEKAALFMLSVGEEHSSILFERMEDEEIRAISLAMSALGSVQANVVEQLFIEFMETLASGGNLIGNFSNTERLLMGALSEDRVKEIMEDMSAPPGKTMWDRLANVGDEVLANYLKNEYPQTAAVVLSKLKPEQASRVLSVLPESFSMECIMRMLRMEPVQKDILEHLEKTLRAEFMSNLVRGKEQDSHEIMAEIFNSLDKNTEEKFMTSLEERSADSAERIKGLMFTFDDLSRLDGGAIQVLLRQVEKDDLALALKGASDEIKDLFFSNMSERAGKMMQEDMEAMGAVRMKDVETAQVNTVQACKELADKGEIMMAFGDDEMVS